MSVISNILTLQVLQACNINDLIYIKWLNSLGAWEFEACERTQERGVNVASSTLAREYSEALWSARAGLDRTVQAETQDRIKVWVQPISIEHVTRYLDFMHQATRYDVFMLRAGLAAGASVAASDWIRCNVTGIDSNIKYASNQFFITFELNLPARDY